MKYLLFILFILFAFTLNAQTIWYVDRDAGGENDGTSWANAWTSPANIDFDDISAGDTIYISGGTDSTMYTTTSYYGFGIGIQPSASPSWTFASGNPVVIAPAWHTNHNGEVWLQTSASPLLNVMAVGNVSNIKITGLNFYRGGIQFGNSDWGDVDSLMFFENNNMISTGETGFIFLNGSKITIRNNYLEMIENSSPNDHDPFGISQGRGGHIIDNNIIIINNDNDTTDAHRDGIQMSNFGLGETLGGVYATERLPMTISNNLIINLAEISSGQVWNAMLYSSGPYCNAIFYVYNNIVVNKFIAGGVSTVWIGKGGILPWTKYDNSLHVLNNTFINGGDEGTIITGYNHDTMIVKNNIFVIDSSNGWDKIHNLDGSDGFPNCYKVYDHNFYGVQGGTYTQRFAVDNGLNIDWAGWRGETYNQDLNSIMGNASAVSFAEKYGILPEDYYTTTGREAGENLYDDYPFLRTDILGNERPETGAWDIGALQYQEGGVDTIPSYSFTAVTGAERNTLYTASAVFSGADSTFTVYTTTDASFSINSGAFNTTTKTAENGDTLNVRNTTGGLYSQLYRHTMIAGGVSRNFDVTTKAEPVSPPTTVKRAVTSSGKELRTINGKRILTR